jgi:hypothetical protein
MTDIITYQNTDLFSYITPYLHEYSKHEEFPTTSGHFSVSDSNSLLRNLSSNALKLR